MNFFVNNSTTTKDRVRSREHRTFLGNFENLQEKSSHYRCLEVKTWWPPISTSKRGNLLNEDNYKAIIFALEKKIYPNATTDLEQANNEEEWSTDVASSLRCLLAFQVLSMGHLLGKD